MVECIEQVTDEEPEQLNKKNGFILVLSLLVAVLYDVLFYDKIAGISYPIFIILLYTVMFQKMRKFMLKKWCFQCFLTLPVLALSLTYLFYSNQVLRTINSLLIPVMLVAHILLITEKKRYEWFRWGFSKDILHGLLVRPIAHISEIVHLIPKLTRKNNELTKNSIIKRIIVGIFFALPVLVIVTALLSSADLVFGIIVNKALSNINIADILKQILLIGAITVLAGSYIWGLTYSEREQVSCQDVNRNLDEVSVLTGLCLLNIVYGVFSYIQFAYLFGSLSNLLPEGFTYAEYARKGFFELVVVAIVNVAIVLGSLNFTKISGVLPGRIFKILNGGLVASTLVMLFSSFVRMYLYEEVYGYTYLRVFTHEFMIMLFFMLCITLYRVWSGKLNLAKWYIVISLISYVLINYINADVFIAQRNMERYYKMGSIDVDCLADMSYDTTPYLEELTKCPNPLLAASAQKAIAVRQRELAVAGNWQSYNFSKHRAINLLNKY
jgi:hypothetical protein